MLDAGWSVVVDAAFLKRNERDNSGRWRRRNVRSADLACAAPVSGAPPAAVCRHVAAMAEGYQSRCSKSNLAGLSVRQRRDWSRSSRPPEAQSPASPYRKEPAVTLGGWVALGRAEAQPVEQARLTFARPRPSVQFHRDAQAPARPPARRCRSPTPDASISRVILVGTHVFHIGNAVACAPHQQMNAPEQTVDDAVVSSMMTSLHLNSEMARAFRPPFAMRSTMSRPSVSVCPAHPQGRPDHRPQPAPRKLIAAASYRCNTGEAGPENRRARRSTSRGKYTGKQQPTMPPHRGCRKASRRRPSRSSV